MFLLIKLVFIAAFLFALTVLVGMATLAIKVRRHLRNPFEERHDAFSSRDAGNVIEGEYTVLDEEGKE